MKYFTLLMITICFTACIYPDGENSKIVHLTSFSSKYVPARDIDIWIPENYTPNKKYDVLYMHDGQMLFDSASTWNKQAWIVDNTMSKLTKENKIRPTIVVAIWNITELRTIEYFPNKPYLLLSDSIKNHLLPTSPESDHYLKFITQELKPYIDETYSTYGDMQHTFIAGSSMGALISLYALCEYPEIFGGTACLSTHWPGINKHNIEIPSALKNYLEDNLPSSNNHKIYFDYGSETLDSLYKPYQMMVDTVLLRKGYSEQDWISKEYMGHAHDERSWAKRFHFALEFLLKKEHAH
ncbi:alpha/beta hydrolase [Saccharicrinis fermentans]|uniref:Endo-1,4-beta-xylanase Z n=1 Tax=Saccharicrinis fermentans DSM 9555 = JCM 21142 TaxID=869213 RepID=W7Y8P6_9BACT|nr:alpha/beta hydrolase-fold protein [Saccharicrinis fermentans]GAF04597.1 endo-1,4-beta-xylanase Z precursor [Saccharicrinis fermentans DSM 9555 = JCM 21142]